MSNVSNVGPSSFIYFLFLSDEGLTLETLDQGCSNVFFGGPDKDFFIFRGPENWPK